MKRKFIGELTFTSTPFMVTVKGVPIAEVDSAIAAVQRLIQTTGQGTIGGWKIQHDLISHPATLTLICSVLPQKCPRRHPKGFSQP